MQLPIFNQNRGGIRRAESVLDLAEANLNSLELETSNAIALAHAKVLNARRRVELHREKLVPLRERVVQRMQEQANYMLVGVFELIRARQEEYDAYQSYLEAVRDYWQSRTELALAIGAPLPSGAQASAETVAPELPEAATENNRMGAMTDMQGMDMQDTPGKEIMDHAAPPKADPAAVKAACDQVKNADMSDPLMQALALKCRKQGDKAAPKIEHGDH